LVFISVFYMKTHRKGWVIKMKKQLLIVISVLILAIISACNCENSCSEQNVEKKASSEMSISEEVEGIMDNTYVKREGVEVIYLAGGCFWGTEKLMQTIPGVIEATSGYANGEEGVTPNYGIVSDTGFKETVRVEYKPAKVSLDMILFTYFRSIDPTITNKQGNDRGPQYQTGIYWVDDATKDIVLNIAEVEKGRFPDFAVEIEPLRNFFDAEEYHQNYLEKNSGGYCHISLEEFELAGKMIIDPANYRRPLPEEIKAKLTKEQFAVTQNGATEPPFDNEYWDNHEKGIYVDIVTGEPLFSSSQKFDSGTGWPSFTQGIDENVFVFLTDNSLGMKRIEVLSRAGNSHLGHVFYGKSESPNGVRFCINSAALRFIPYDDMESEGYGYLKEYVL